MRFQTFRNEQGAILVIALIFVCILAISGTMAYQMTANEFLIARNFDDSREALNAATAGIEEARVRLGLPRTDTNAIYDDGSIDPWIANPNSLQPDPPYQIEIQHKTDAGNLVYYGYPPSDLTISASSTATEYRPVDIITSSGTGEKSRITIRAEVVHNPGPPILAALYAELPIVDDSTTSPPPTFTGSGSILGSYVFGTSGQMNINIPDGITSLKQWETSSTPSACLNNLDNDKICSSSGDLTVTAPTGSGVLLVQGKLTLQGTYWDGLILVRDGLILNGGSIQGAVLVNGGVWINSDTANQGNVSITYDRSKIDAALSSIPLRILSWQDDSMMP